MFFSPLLLCPSQAFKHISVSMDERKSKGIKLGQLQDFGEWHSHTHISSIYANELNLKFLVAGEFPARVAIRGYRAPILGEH